MEERATTYALVDDHQTYKLTVGKNVVGRSTVPVEGVAFINLKSQRAAISRMQAIVEVAPNGDAWISDCNSTNGTFLAIRDGQGVRLEPNRYYQLSDGCRIVFGDVAQRFVALHTPVMADSQTDEPEEISGAHQESALSLREKEFSKPVTAQHVPEIPKRATPHVSRPLENGSSTLPGGRKRNRTADGSSPIEGNSPSKAGSTQVLSGHTENLLVCLSGMEEDQRKTVKKAVQRHGGRVVEDIMKANLLVVNVPVVRTPKFIIAVGRGIPVVSEEYLEGPTVDSALLPRFTVTLTHDTYTYTAAVLLNSITKSRAKPILQGLSFNVASLPARSRGVAKQILMGCGAEVVHKKSAAAIAVTAESLSDIYDGILRGRRP